VIKRRRGKSDATRDKPLTKKKRRLEKKGRAAEFVSRGYRSKKGGRDYPRSEGEAGEI